MTKGERVRLKIIEATIASIEADGLGQVTVRTIAARADVNLAAISYYFGSKENLVALTLDATIEHMFADVSDILARVPADPTQELNGLLSYLLEGSLRYPSMTRAHLHDAFVKGDYSGTFARRFGGLLDQLADALRTVLPQHSRATRRQLGAQTLSTIFLPAFFIGLYEPSKLLATKAKRDTYIALAVQRLLAD